MTTSEEKIPEETGVFGTDSTGNLSILISTVITKIILTNSQYALTKQGIEDEGEAQTIMWQNPELWFAVVSSTILHNLVHFAYLTSAFNICVIQCCYTCFPMVSCTLRPVHEARHVTHHKVNQAASRNTADQ